MDFEAFVRDITENNWNVFGTEVYENGELKYSYGDTKEIHEIYSATKTVLSVAFGIAYDEGLIDLDRPVADYIPEAKAAKEAEKAEGLEAFSKITVRRLLTMSVIGFPFRAEGDNYLKFALSCDIKPEETGFNYSNISAYLAGVCLTNAIGYDLGRFIEERIFKPLNIIKYEYGRSPEGYFYGASKMKMSVNDLSKIGLLLMNRGVYNGIRILSEEYVDMATSVQMMNREGGYGFFVWMYRDGFSINGKLKQKCYVLPKRGIVVTYLAHIEDDSKDLLYSMEENILGISCEDRAVERITQMEKIFDHALMKLRDIREGSLDPEKISAEISVLEAYYTGKAWKEDLKLDEEGRLPSDLKRGVLSEDGIYDLLEEYDAVRRQ